MKRILLILFFFMTAIAINAQSLATISNGTITVGIDLNCGGTLSYLGTPSVNYVNRWDCGREIQFALYDGAATYDNCSGCTGVFGWNPTQGGDTYRHGSPVVAQSFSTNQLWTKTLLYEWFPDNKGGGPNTPVLSDVQMEQWVTLWPPYPRLVSLHYKITHVGSDTHALAQHAVPAIFMTSDFTQARYYAGTRPWRHGATRTITVPEFPTVPKYSTSESWFAAMNAPNYGVTFYYPNVDPAFDASQMHWGGNSSGSFGIDTIYFQTDSVRALGPGAVLEGELYMYVGDPAEMRSIIYQSLGK